MTSNALSLQVLDDLYKKIDEIKSVQCELASLVAECARLIAYEAQDGEAVDIAAKSYRLLAKLFSEIEVK